MYSKLIFLFLFFTSFMFSQKADATKTVDGFKVSFEKVKYKETWIGVMGSDSKQAFATYIEGDSSDKKQRYYQTIKFQSTNFQKKSAPIYLCIYENENGLPGKLIDKAKILLHIPSKKNRISVDLSQKLIPVPHNGYFVGFEWIRSKENKINGNAATEDSPYNPTISGFTANNINLYSYHGKWQKEADSHLVAGLELEIIYSDN
ncbi:MAG: hypothetical protein ACXWCA_02870 [Kaistella sp.]